MEKISVFLKEFGVLITVGMVGIGILIYGLWGVVKPEEAVVEIVKSNSPIANSPILKSETQIVVDVAGAVEKPGVYKLPSGSRIGDALVLAGGVSAKADREWIAKTLNLAEAVKDEAKIYIPARSEGSNLPNSPNLANKPNSKVNINTASVAELDALVGIGEARAKAIIANRPYGSTEELVSNAKIPQSVYEKIKDSISVY